MHGNLTPTQLLFLWGVTLILGALSNKLSRKFNLPVLLMFLGIGLFLGRENQAGLTIANRDLRVFINNFGTLAMSFILYAGGLSTRFSTIRRVLLPGAVLAVFGVILTALTFGLACFGLNRLMGYSDPFVGFLLLGALVSSTDASAVFSILRGKNVSLKGDLAPLLELESGSNDPMAAILTIFLLSYMQMGTGFTLWALPELAYALLVGALIGAFIGYGGQYLFRLKLEYDGLYFVIGVGMVLLSYSVATLLKANGFMSVYVCGMVMGNMRFYLQKGLRQFSDGISWLMQVALFMMLGFLVNTGDLFSPGNIKMGLLSATAMLLLARPIAVFLCLSFSRFSFREKLLVSWVGLRGAAPIVLATYPLSRELLYANHYFNIVFFTVLTSVLVQGLTLMPLARLLKLDAPAEDHERAPLELEIVQENGDEQYEMFEFFVPSGNPLAGKAVKETRLPQGARILLIRRENHFLSPDGSTILQAGDGLFIMGKVPAIQQIARELFPGSDFHQLKNVRDINRSIKAARKRNLAKLVSVFQAKR